MRLKFGIRTKIRTAYRHLTSKPNKDALFIFGFQKSGTSAIAGLLAEKTGKSVSIDTKYLWEPYQSEILKGSLTIEKQVRKYSYDFSKEIIKEPSATFFIPQLNSFFPLDKYIFIVRNPFDNIRSILDRLKLPGNLENLNYDDILPSWQYIFEEQKGKDYIGVLAKRWVLANDQLDVLESSKCVLVKYEDFKKDKENYIDELAMKLDYKPINSISHLLNKQYQPKGNANVDLHKFFGDRNYRKIEDICGELMQYLKY